MSEFDFGKQVPRWVVNHISNCLPIWSECERCEWYGMIDPWKILPFVNSYREVVEHLRNVTCPDCGGDCLYKKLVKVPRVCRMPNVPFETAKQRSCVWLVGEECELETGLSPGECGFSNDGQLEVRAGALKSSY